MHLRTLVENIRELPDPRRQYGYLQHKLEKIVMIAFCATICGAEDFEDIEEFGNARETWLGTFLDVENGIPDKDTFRRVFERLDPAGLGALKTTCIGNWMSLLAKTPRGNARIIRR
jgi:hypothetical protein